MKTTLLVTALVLSPLSWADCALDQNLCETTCNVRFVTNDAEKAGCISRCVAERTICSTKAGTEKAKDLGQEVWQESKSFLDGFTADSAKELGFKAWENTKSFMDGLIKKEPEVKTD